MNYGKFYNEEQAEKEKDRKYSIMFGCLVLSMSPILMLAIIYTAVHLIIKWW